MSTAKERYVRSLVVEKESDGILKACPKCGNAVLFKLFYPSDVWCMECRDKADEKEERNRVNRLKRATEPRVCRECGVLKPVVEFYVTGSYCKVCMRRRSGTKQLTEYGITKEQYLEMSAAQNDKCACCGRPESATTPSGKVKALCVDHCHKTNVVRGLLCSNCNSGLGMFKDDPAIILSAAAYLERNKQ